MLRQGRDSTRMREIGTLHRAISMLRIDTPAAPLGSSNTIHVSIPDTSTTCDNLGLPTPPPGWVYRCVSAANLRNINGTGWIPIDFTVMPRGSPLASLLIDPVNTVASSNFYVFVTDGRTWALASLMESERHAPAAARDGGTDAARFEAGTNLSLWTSASGLVGYWSFDEGAGTTARDLSGRGNTGSLHLGTLGNIYPAAAWVPGQVGRALSFDGVDDFVNVGNHASLAPIEVITITAWIKPSNPGGHMQSIIANSPAGHQFNYWLFVDASSLGLSAYSVTFPDLIVPGVIPTAHIWYHVAFTASRGGIMRIFVNGNQVGSGTAGTGHWPGGFTTIGELRPGRVLHFNGLIDEVRIHNRALSAAEIRASFNATR